MTLAAQNTWTVEDANGSKAAFDINFKVYDTSAIEVRLIAADGTETLQQAGVDYAVTGSAGAYQVDFSGLAGAPADGLQVAIRSTLSASQGEGFDDFSKFPASKAEGALDRAYHLIQGVQAVLDRTVRMPADENGLVYPAAAELVGKVPVRQADGSWLLIATTDLETVAAGIDQVKSVAANISDVTTVGNDLALGASSVTIAAAALVNAGSPGIPVVLGPGSVAVRALTAGTGVTVTNGNGAGGNPTVAIGQDVAASASPSFAGLAIAGTPVLGVTSGIAQIGSTEGDWAQIDYRGYMRLKGGAFSPLVRQSDNPVFDDGTKIKDFFAAFTPPTVDGTAGQVLTTDGSGGLTFTSSGNGNLRDNANETVSGAWSITGVWGHTAPMHLLIDIPGVTKASTTYAGGERGPMLIWSNKSFSGGGHVAGEVLGLKIAVASSLTATPALNDAVALQVVASNEFGRAQLWGFNCVALQDPTGADGNVRAAEFEVNAVLSENIDPFNPSLGPRKIAIEAVAQGNGVYRTTAAFWAWSAPSTNSAWHHCGLALSRIADVGVRFGVWLGDDPTAASTASFRTAAILDQSQSVAVLKVENNHESIIDLSGLGNITDFVKCRPDADTTLRFRSAADYGVNLVLDAGSTGAKQKSLLFNDRGSAVWAVIANAGDGNGFAIFNYVTSKSSIFVAANDDVTFEGAINLGASRVLTVGGNQVVGARVVDARLGDTANSGDATTDGIIAALQAALNTHGLARAA